MSIRVATVGAGYFSRYHCDAWSRLDVDLAAICDRDQAACRAMADQYGIAQRFTDAGTMLARVSPDLLDIITPPASHLPLIDMALGAGVTVICQKPFTENLEQAERAAALARHNDVALVVHENFRFQPWHAEVKAIIDSGALGRIYQVTFRLRPGDGQGPGAYLDRQPYFRTMQRFLIHETGIHFVDVFRYLLGEVESVSAQLARLNPVISGEDAGIVVFQFAGGARAVFDANRLVDHAAENTRLTMGEMLVEGSRGTLRLDGDGKLYQRAHGERPEAPVEYEWSPRGFGGDCVYRLQKHVIEHLTRGAPLVNEARDYLENLRAEQAIYRSHTEGRTVRLRRPNT